EAEIRRQRQRIRTLFVGALICLAFAGIASWQWRQAAIERARTRALQVEVAKVVDLTGLWSCNDGAIYAIRQQGRDISWIGHNPPYFINRFEGSITDEGYIEGNWHDLPGFPAHNAGRLRLKIDSFSRLVANSQTGGFGGTIWIKK